MANSRSAIADAASVLGGGNRGESEEVYRYMQGYSPYDNVEAKECPHMLAPDVRSTT